MDSAAVDASLFPFLEHDLSFHMPSKLHSHPIIIVNPTDYSPSLSGHARALMIEPYVHNDRSIGGFFVRPEDARRIGLTVVGEGDTIYGSLTQYSPLDIVLFSRHATITNVFELPHQFKGTKYEQGVVGIETFWALGVSLVLDRGMIYIQDPEKSGYASYTKSAPAETEDDLDNTITSPPHLGSSAPISIIHHRRNSESIPLPNDKPLSFGYAYGAKGSLTSPPASLASSLSDVGGLPMMSPPDLTASTGSSWRDRYVVWD